jgi:hypothetical protein
LKNERKNCQPPVLARKREKTHGNVLLQKLDRRILQRLNRRIDVPDGLSTPDVAETVDFEEGVVAVTRVVDEREMSGDVDEGVLAVEFELWMEGREGRKGWVEGRKGCMR